MSTAAGWENIGVAEEFWDVTIEVLEDDDTLVGLKRVNIDERTAEIALLRESEGWTWDASFEGGLSALHGPHSSPYGGSCACVVVADWNAGEVEATLYLAVGR